MPQAIVCFEYRRDAKTRARPVGDQLFSLTGERTFTIMALPRGKRLFTIIERGGQYEVFTR